MEAQWVGNIFYHFGVKTQCPDPINHPRFRVNSYPIYRLEELENDAYQKAFGQTIRCLKDSLQEHKLHCLSC